MPNKTTFKNFHAAADIFQNIPEFLPHIPWGFDQDSDKLRTILLHNCDVTEFSTMKARDHTAKLSGFLKLPQLLYQKIDKSKSFKGSHRKNRAATTLF